LDVATGVLLTSSMAALAVFSPPGAEAPLLCALAVFGIDRILFAVNYPFGDSATYASFIEKAPFSPADKDRHGDAEKLLTRL